MPGFSNTDSSHKFLTAEAPKRCLEALFAPRVYGKQARSHKTGYSLWISLRKWANVSTGYSGTLQERVRFTPWILEGRRKWLSNWRTA